MLIKYEDRIVAFIDILGFAGKISESSSKHFDGNKKLNEICEAVFTIDDYIREGREILDLPKSSNVTQFSDSIVISLKIEDSYKMLSIFRLLKRIQVNLIRQKFLIRGGIARGEIVHTDKLLLGPGVVDAYNLESKCAQTPRIVIEQEVLSQFAQEGGERKKLLLQDFKYHKSFKKDDDGNSYIDYFNDIEDYLSNGDAELYFRDLCALIKANIDSDDKSIQTKYSWMREKLKNSEYYSMYESIYSEFFIRKSK